MAASSFLPWVILIGLPGSGKTTIGRRLAQRLDVDFIDSDHEIVAHSGCSIASFFARHGEAAFRSLERRMITDLLAPPARVLASGGGAFLDPRLRGVFRRWGLSVWLTEKPSLLVRRIMDSAIRRPLLEPTPAGCQAERESGIAARLADLCAERDPIYAEADIVFNLQGRTATASACALAAVIAAHPRWRLGLAAELQLGASER